MANYGYNFYFAYDDVVMIFPITPSELSINVGSNNKVVTLINDGDINILKSPALTEINFEARFPMRKYPYSREPWSFQRYFDQFKKIKEDKRSIRFIVVRTTPNDKVTWDTNMLVSIESMELKESADHGDDVIISFKLKQFKEYGVKRLASKPQSNTTTSTSDGNREQNNAPSNSGDTNYTVKPGDTLWGISKQQYGDGSHYTEIYNANATTIEKAAKNNGHASSSNGSLIFPGTRLNMPSVRA